MPNVPSPLLAQMRALVESAPTTVRPFLFMASATFLKREEHRWMRLAADTHLTEQRFLNFLECPSSYDLMTKAIVAVNEEGEGGAPANASGNAGIAGIGQPPGTKFGEPGVLRGATTKTKKKNRIAETVTARVEPSGTKFKLVDPNGRMLQGGFSTRAEAENTLKQWKDVDDAYERDKATRVDEDVNEGYHNYNTRKYERERCFDCNGKGVDFGEACLTCGGKGYYYIDKKTGDHEYAISVEDDKLDEETFAGADVFDVDMDRWMKSRYGKGRYHRYSRYVGTDKLGETIRQHGRKSKNDIVLKDQATGVMTYLRRKQMAR